MKEVALGELVPGSIVRVVSGAGEDTHEYAFTITEAGDEPLATMAQRLPQGDSWIGPVSVRLAGSGPSVDKGYENLTDMGHRLDVAEETQPPPPSDGVMRVGHTILVHDARQDVEPPRGGGWHEIGPLVAAIHIQRPV